VDQRAYFPIEHSGVDRDLLGGAGPGRQEKILQILSGVRTYALQYRDLHQAIAHLNHFIQGSVSWLAAHIGHCSPTTRLAPLSKLPVGVKQQ
jgi:hypothetical protein